MKVGINRINNDYRFEGVGQTRIPVLIDNKTQFNAYGSSPMELLLMSVGGCSAIDIVHILKKQRQIITSYRAEIDGTREEIHDATPFTKIHVTIYLEGLITKEKALKAAALSFKKYCSAAMTLGRSLPITYDIILNDLTL